MSSGQRLRQLVDAERDQVGDRLGQLHVHLEHFPLAHRHGALAERVVVVGQRVAARVQRAGYRQRVEVRRAGRDRDRRDRHQILGRVVVHDGRVRRARGRRARLVHGQAARLDVRVHAAAERARARVPEHVVVGRLVVVLVPPANRHRALEAVPLVRERRRQRLVLVRVRVRRPHGFHVEVLEAVVHEEPATVVPVSVPTQR